MGGADTLSQGAPWDSFIAARAKLAAGHRDEAVRLWLHIAARTDIEARHVLQAWTFLRQAGVAPEAEHAKDVLGVVVSVPVQHGHDVLAAYRDGSVRYINFSGAAVVVNNAPPAVSDAERELLEQGRILVSCIGPWTEPQLPPLGQGDARLMVLTPGGPHFGQGPFSALGSDPMARPVLDAAFRLLNGVLSGRRQDTAYGIEVGTRLHARSTTLALAAGRIGGKSTILVVAADVSRNRPPVR